MDSDQGRAVLPPYGTSARAGPLDANAGQLRVLVVDDNPLNRFLASELLSQWGIEPMLAGDGAEAVALASGHQFDLILMDLQMPVLDGLAATAQIRRLEREQSGARAAVVAYTSSPFNGRDSLLQTFGLDAVLEKHCDSSTLRECLLRWCPPGKSAWLDRPASGLPT